MDFIGRAKATPTARLVKWADLRHDRDRNRLPVITPKDEVRFAKYEAAWVEILNEDGPRSEA